MTGKVDIAVTEAAHEEVANTRDEETRRRRLERLRAFKTVGLAASQGSECDELTNRLHTDAFPNADTNSRTNDHNRRDCRQVAAHKLSGRAVFVTRDDRLLKKARIFGNQSIEILRPSQLLENLAGEDGSQESAAGAVSVRGVDLPSDETSVRSILAPLRDDYPDFDGWLTKTLNDSTARIRVAEVDGRIAAVSVTKRKDDRVMKLAAFYVAEFARAGGVGGHLLWTEIRSWVEGSFDKAYVTVSSRHFDLVEFFGRYGFLIEGVSARRYGDDASELVLAKHLVRMDVTHERLDDFKSAVAERVFGLPREAEVPTNAWGIVPVTDHPDIDFEGAGADLSMRIRSDGEVMRELDIYELENIFHPLRLAIPDRKVLVLPLHPEWADAMVSYVGQQAGLFDSNADTSLMLRTDNVYYCAPKHSKSVARGTPLLLYVTSPTMSFVGEARIDDFLFASPAEVFAEFGDIGVYDLENIGQHVGRGVRGEFSGKVLALRFSMYTNYPDPIEKSEAEAILGKNLTLQGLAAISYEDYELLRRNSGLDW